MTSRELECEKTCVKISRRVGRYFDFDGKQNTALESTLNLPSKEPLCDEIGGIIFLEALRTPNVCVSHSRMTS